MCGICGEIRFDQNRPSLSAVERMTEELAPRGPDGQGLFSQNHIAFGHRRLCVMDLSEHSQQPMVDSELGLAICFNGAIYNYPELRQELKSKGYRFFSNGDTEVLLKAYHHWGEDFVQHLNGMFALAIWERDSGKVVFARDRLGIKPFYYSESQSHLRFASTLPAILAGGAVDTEIDPVALHHYMTFHSVVPSPHTILNGVKKLPPATLLIVEPDGSKRFHKYWELSFGANLDQQSFGEQEWKDCLHQLLRKSISGRLVADVSVGVLLSGGLDSSLVVGLLAEAGQAGIETFSIGFESVGDEKGDEFYYSDIIAERYQTKHHRILIDSSKALPALDRCVRAMSEPMVSHDNIGFYLLSEEVSQHVKVVQSGQGADEIFGGYHWYPPLVDSSTPVSDYSKVFFDRTHAEYSQIVNERFVSDDFSTQYVAAQFERSGASDPVDKALRIDSTVMLVEDPVKRVDNMTMAWGLEARVPFLDHHLVEFAARIPSALKIKGDGKYLLKQAARDIIPADVIDRPKGYFPVPALKYLKGPYLERVKDVLSAEPARRRAIFNQEYLDQLLAAPMEHITPLRGSKLWQVAMLEYWLQSHNIS